MIRHIWSVLCRKSLIDDVTNNISILDVFERFQGDVVIPEAVKAPLVAPIDFEVVSFWLKEKDNIETKGEVKIILVDPKEAELAQFGKGIVIPKDVKRLRSRMRVNGLPLTESGNYFVQVYLKESGKDKFVKVAEVPIEVQLNITKQK